MKIALTVGSLLLCLGSIIAQNEEDVLRYSQLNFGGSARYNSTAGAFGALGADLSVLSVNPAGMARFKNSEFSITPLLNVQKTSTLFNGTGISASSEKATLGNLGIVGVSKASEDSPYKWRSIQFGVAYNKLADFKGLHKVSGTSTNSLSYVFAAQANAAAQNNGVSPEQLLTNFLLALVWRIGLFLLAQTTL